VITVTHWHHPSRKKTAHTENSKNTASKKSRRKTIFRENTAKLHNLGSRGFECRDYKKSDGIVTKIFSCCFYRGSRPFLLVPVHFRISLCTTNNVSDQRGQWQP
jgi:hypothetical protein